MTLREYLKSLDVDYSEVRHPREVTTSRIAQQAHITGDQMAKAVLIKCDSGYRVAVVPASCRTDLGKLSHILHERLGLAVEEEIAESFNDCDAGALPPLGQAYGIPVCVDDALLNQPDIYFEAGDHETLVHMRGSDFSRLMANAEHGHFSHHM
ncbi:MAG: YbaK/EbsC family protein [Ectothiorhodospiraceae bacterium]|nr:YbaK/EbsC family protein [Ectothiorhodospiraceae bacterium]